MMLVYLVLAAAILGVGAMLLPPVKEITTAIFEMFNMDALATPFLKVIISFWPVFILASFVLGAVMMIRGRGTQ